ncbi:MAG: methyltransferase domain-containing protein [Pseudomonadota bacterium]
MKQDKLTPEVVDSQPYTMSSLVGKLVLALVRESDYAHAGEAEAIDLVFEHLPRGESLRVLDVGCGIGGTAQYVTGRGWGHVTGIDIDPDNVATAKARHPGISFICTDAATMGAALRAELVDPVPGFDVIYALNAFFLFARQARALTQMRTLARPGARLAIFDYVERVGRADGGADLRSSLNDASMAPMLAASGWRLLRTDSYDAHYLRWYEELVQRITAKRDAVVAASSEGFFEYVLGRYSQTRDDVKAGRLGGATFYAEAV